MDPSHYRRVKEIFLEAAAVPRDERPDFLDHACAGDDRIRSEIESLLEHHHDDTLIASDPPGKSTEGRGPFVASDSATTAVMVRILGRGKGQLLVVAIGIVVLAALAAWTHRGVHKSVLDMRTEELVRAVDSIEIALDAWTRQEKKITRVWASDPRILKLSQEVFAAIEAGAGIEEIQSLPARIELLQVFNTWGYRGEHQRERAVGLFDPTGMIVAENYNEEGLRLSRRGMRYFIEALAGETVFIPPYLAPEIADYQSWEFGGPPPGTGGYVAYLTPLLDNAGDVVGVVGSHASASGAFSDVFKAGFIGETGEAYAFDERGRIVSVSRFDQQLRDLGLLPEDTTKYPIDVELRDPGTELVDEASIPQDLGTRPFTRPASLALARRTAAVDQQSGTILDPYRDYRGKEVIGAWRWLEELDFGIIVEIDADEAFAPVRYLEITYGVLLTIVAVLAGAALLTFIRTVRLKQKLGHLRKLGSYRVDRLLGVGGMGEVYLARHATLDRPTAVKIVRQDRLSPESIERFEREVRLAATLRHPNTIEIYDFGRSEDGTFFYAMEYVDGLNLAELITIERQIPPARIIHILRQVCGALHEAHHAGIIHRDIKPQNIMLCERAGETDVVKVLDFGLVKNLDDTDSIDAKSLAGIRGSPLYMAPERFNAPLDVTGNSDIYSVGAVAYEMLCGRPVFDPGESGLDLIYRVVEESPRDLSDTADLTIPEPLVDFVMRCLAKDPADRPQSTEIRDVLAELSRQWPWPAERASAWWQAWRGVA